jgi:DnaK suppressor protein
MAVNEMKTKAAKRMLETHLDVVLARLQGEAEVPKAETAGSDFLDVAQGVELQELAQLTASRLAERAKRLRDALARVADGEYGVCSQCGAAIPPNRLLAVPDATTCVACQERLELARH